jgi:hypothetical protein
MPAAIDTGVDADGQRIGEALEDEQRADERVRQTNVITGLLQAAAAVRARTGGRARVAAPTRLLRRGPAVGIAGVASRGRRWGTDRGT